MLRVLFQHADIHFAHQRGDVLVVLITWLGFSDGDLIEDRRVELHYLELGDITAILLQPLSRPGRHDAFDVTARNAVILFKDFAVLHRIE